MQHCQQSTVCVDNRHEACLLDTHLLYVTLSGPSDICTCQRTPGPTCSFAAQRPLPVQNWFSIHHVQQGNQVARF